MTSLYVIKASAKQLSVAVAVPVLEGKVFAVQEIVTFAGQVIPGPVLSTTIIFWMHVLLLPQSSVPVHVLNILHGGGSDWMIN